MYDQSYADYSAGQYDLAVDGFQAFIRTFPTSPRAAEAQLYTGYSLYNAGKNADAVTALNKVISDYPQSNSVSSAYYKLGLTYEALKQPDNARKAFETVVQKYPSSYDAVLAQQALERLKRREQQEELTRRIGTRDSGPGVADGCLHRTKSLLEVSTLADSRRGG